MTMMSGIFESMIGDLTWKKKLEDENMKLEELPKIDKLYIVATIESIEDYTKTKYDMYEKTVTYLLCKNVKKP